MTRARRVVAVAVLAALVAVASACGGDVADGLPGGAGGGAPAVAGSDAPAPDTVAEGAGPTLPVTVSSADGRQVTVDDVSRVVPLQGSIAEVVFDLGLGDAVVGRDISATFAAAAHLPVVTRAHDVSAEAVLSLRPTVVLADTETGPPEALDHIRNVGVPVVVLERPTALDHVGPRIEAVARALGVPDAGRALAEDVQGAVDDAAASAPADGERPRVAFLYLRGSAGVALLGGPGAGTDSLIEAVGGIDAGTALGLDDAFTPITPEALASAAPDALLVTTTGLESVGGPAGLADVAGVAQTPAGRNGRIIAVEDGLLFSFGTRTPDALRTIADQLHGGGG